MVHRSALQGFAQASEAYEQGRPGYPPEAVACLVRELGLRPGRVVLDLAAGTGKLTALLLGTGADVVAVEPVAEMRAVLERTLPDVVALAGSAEEIPLEANGVDAVIVAQAFHWFRGDEALAEIHRVLRPGGGLGLVWNVRDPGVPWVAGLSEIIEPYRGDAPAFRTGAWREAFERTDLFEPLGRAQVRHVHRLPPEAVIARVVSISFIAALSQAKREGVLARVRELLATDPATRGRNVIELPYRADLFWTRTLGA